MAAPAIIPTVSDGNVLSAAHMNLISAWINYLDGLASGQNNGFEQYDDTSPGSSSHTATFEHQYNENAPYLHWKVTFAGKNHDDLQITYNGTNIFSDGGNTPPVYSPSRDYDLSGLGLTTGTRYSITIKYKFQEGGGSFSVNYLYSDKNPTV